MRLLLISIFVISLVSIMIIPNVFASHDSDKQLGTVNVDKSVLGLPYTTASNSNYETVKIFGVIEEPRSATWVYLTITEPDGNTYQVKSVASGSSNYENYILICCNNVGQYSVYAEWRGYHIGTVTFEVIEKPATQEGIKKVPNWVRNIFVWYASEQISEDELLHAIKYLVNQGIINLNE